MVEAQRGTRRRGRGAEEPDPTEEVKFILYPALFIVLAGKFFTDSFLWKQELPNVRQFVPVRAAAVSLP